MVSSFSSNVLDEIEDIWMVAMLKDTFESLIGEYDTGLMNILNLY